MLLAVIFAPLLFLGAPSPDARPPASADASRPALAEPVEALLRAGDARGAVEAGERAVREDPESARRWIALGKAYGARAQSAPLLSRLRFARKCRSAFAAAVRLDPLDIEARRDLFQYDLRAPRIAGGGRDLARREAEEILALDAAFGHAARGALAAAEGRREFAEAEFRRALEISPECEDARVGLGDLLLESRRYDEVRGLWEGAAGGEPGRTAHYQIGRACLLSGSDLARGIRHLQACLSLPAEPGEPTRADVRRQLALLYEKLGRREDAPSEPRQALRLEGE